MATKKKVLAVYLDEQTIRDFDKVAEAVHLDKNSFGALLISRFAELKLEHGLDAVTSIPREYFKARPGRPSSTNALVGDLHPTLAHQQA